jgi:UDP-glucose 4-epimerase
MATHELNRCSLITGGAGFVGSHLARRLVAKGESVIVVDDLSLGRLDRLADVRGNPRLEVHVGSAADETLIRKHVQRADRVFHFAATLGVRRVIEHPAACFENNIRTTSVVVTAAAAAGRLLVLASSSEVYGKSMKIPFREDDECAAGITSNPRWIYAGSKALGEALAFAYRREHALPVIVVRLFNTVGPGQSADNGFVLPTFVRQAVRGEPITVHGSGRQTRCFSHVADVVEAILRLADTPAAIGQVVNVGGDHEVTILELAEQVRTAARSASPIVQIATEEAFPEGLDDPPRRVPDLSRLQRLTGFRASISLDATIDELIAEQRQVIQV